MRGGTAWRAAVEAGAIQELSQPMNTMSHDESHDESQEESHDESQDDCSLRRFPSGAVLGTPVV